MAMFESTLPLGAPRLTRVSGFQRYLDEAANAQTWAPGSTRLSSLDPVLQQDLGRFGRSGRRSEMLEVLAASLRHGKALSVRVQHGRQVMPLAVWPRERLLLGPLTAAELLGMRLDELVVLQVDPLAAESPDDVAAADGADKRCRLDLFAWEVALRGATGGLLPELAGSAAYRIAPAADLRLLGLHGTMAAAAQRLRRQTTNLRDLAGWPGFDRERAERLLNGLYLLSALIVSRTHPAATNEGWRAPDSA